MTTGEALNILDLAAQEYKGSRAEHVKIQEAIAVLQQLVHKDDKPKKS